MSPTVLYFTYATVMLASLGCFLQAWRRRLDTPVHRRWGLGGLALSLGGILVVLLVTYGFGWRVVQRYPAVVQVHRVLALGAAPLVLATGFTGWRRWPIHKRLYIVFLPLYAATVATALLGYRP